ncbi:MAG: DUF3127 domain-containing protein [Spirosomaceae bacterium]|jgi:hypothetical protein|nr:DUF3127 domain-containing protein [Spirosomataceae bacterium]MCU0469601.1 DUF3127 domain-containing protein [Arcicella sp.]
MQFSGFIEKVFAETEIKGKDNKSLSKREFLLTIDNGEFPKSICIEVWNDKVSDPNIVEGNLVSVECNIQAREFGGRYFNNIRAWKIEKDKNMPF